VVEEEMESILHHCHHLETGDHLGATKTATKVLQSGFIGLHYSKMLELMLMRLLVINANEVVIFPRKMRYL